ncbi:hypothetical protein [Streptomyces sp. NPDC047315]|uniref:hypothetical protein n=1 Tax=Streptomyces sp. NPDC047315 TaxID=3155142 RepID=UPI0033ED4E9F
MTSAFLQSIPEVTVNPDSGASRATATAEPAPVVQPQRSGGGGGFGRRTFLRTTMAGAATLAFTGLGWLSGGGTAHAAVGRKSRHPAHCMNVDVPGDTPCWGREYIAAKYCAADGYHRTDTKKFGTYTHKYNWEAACDGYAGWYWKTRDGRTVHCWDGYFDLKKNGRTTRHTTSCKSK